MLVLSVESSCDETAVALTENGRHVLSDEICSQVDLHAVYGGVVPELASRSHIQTIARLAESALAKSGVTRADIDAIAVTAAPGLIGALLVGVNFAKAAALALDVPLVPVHHIRGHIAATYIAWPDLEPPFVCLVVSGGHSLIVDVRGYTDMRVIGSTRDDAAGECFDKTARVLGLGYPGGSKLDELASGGDPYKYELPRAKIDGCPLDMSFSGLKTAVINLVHTANQRGETLDSKSLAACLCRAVSDTVVVRSVDAAIKLGYGRLAAAGGVAANSFIRKDLTAAANDNSLSLYLAPLPLCGDNGAMIGCQAYYEYLAGVRADASLNAYASMPADRPTFFDV